MKLFWRKMLLVMGAFLCTSSASMMLPSPAAAFSERVLEVGMTGKDVREMQGRLKFLGFYYGKVDGAFGWSSYWALRNFQYEFGLPVDGVLGPDTKVKLYNATTQYRPTAEELGVAPQNQNRGGGGGTAGAATPGGQQAAAQPTTVRRSTGFSDNDIRLMANAVYGESRGEPYEGQVAVASVILNRTRNPNFPNTPSGVIFEPLAFTAVADGQIWLTPNERAKKAVRDAINGWDPTDGCIYYFNPDTATSAWIWSRPQVKRIGKHIFCR